MIDSLSIIASSPVDATLTRSTIVCPACETHNCDLAKEYHDSGLFKCECPTCRKNPLTHPAIPGIIR